MKYLKQAPPTPPEDAGKPRAVAQEILAAIAAGGEAKCREYCVQFDKWEGEVLLETSAWHARAESIGDQAKADISTAHARIKAFAERQRASVVDFEEDDGELQAGQKLIPMRCAGCYAPGGRYAHICSALMSVTTAKAAGVETVVFASPPRGDGIDPHMLYAAKVAGADKVLCIGGVQAIAALFHGFWTPRAEILAGPGNAFVAEAKRLLNGDCAIDIFAGPTEIAVICDQAADAEIVAMDIVSQAEHGPTSPCWVITTDEALGSRVLERVEAQLTFLPDGTRETATAAWANFGEVVVCGSREEAVMASDEYAAEHLEVLCEDLDWWASKLQNYGSLFLGEQTCVTFGDKCSGPNHVLPTRKAARYTGGLSVFKFLKVCTWQKMTEKGALNIAPVAARLSRYEGMEGHARAGDVRLAKYMADKGAVAEALQAANAPDTRHVAHFAP